MSGRVVVVGLGPGPADLMSVRSRDLLANAPLARLRTRVHPAAAEFPDVESYDAFYESAESFDALYEGIVEDLCRLAGEGTEVVYAVPGSPLVAERTVELLRTREVELVVEPALSVIDLAVGALGVDPMAVGLRIADALSLEVPLRGPGPTLILQTYSPEVMAHVADALAPDQSVVVLHHLGLADEQVVRTSARQLVGAVDADHLTSLYVPAHRDAGVAMADLVDFAAHLRVECPWDRDQTHGSLTRHLLEEAYEAIDALNELQRVEDEGLDDEAARHHAEEELGDVLFQVLFHADLGREAGRFDLATIADAVRDKLIGRHPHIYGDVVVADASDVERNWERIKKDEKGRESVTEGIAWDLPSLTLVAKLLGKAKALGVVPDAPRAHAEASAALARLEIDAPTREVEAVLVETLEALVALARTKGVDLEGAMRQRAHEIAGEVRALESDGAESPRG